MGLEIRDRDADPLQHRLLLFDQRGHRELRRGCDIDPRNLRRVRGETQRLEIRKQPPRHAARDFKASSDIGNRRGMALQQHSISALLDRTYPEKFKWSGSRMTINRCIHDAPPRGSLDLLLLPAPCPLLA